MMKKTFYILVLMLLMSAVLGELTLTLDKSPPLYDRGSNNRVEVSVSCAVGNSSTVHIRNAENPSRLVYIAVGNGTWIVNYNTFSDLSDGRYVLEAFCQEGSNATANFCVNANNCLNIQGPPDLPPTCSDGIKNGNEGCDDGDTSNGDGCSATCTVESGWRCTENAGGLSTCTRVGGGRGDGSDGGGDGGGGDTGRDSSSSGSGSGRRRCTSSWSCDAWGLCNATLTQSRTCTDENQCDRKPRVEARSCTSCQESWVCSLWSECRSGSQYRTCDDEYKCGTFVQRPETEKRCDAPTVGFTPRKISEPVAAPPSTFPPFGQEPVTRRPPAVPPSFLSKYQKFAVRGGIALGILIILVVIIVLFIKRKGKVNSELAAWIGQARSGGKSDTYIRNALVDEGWTEKEIEKALRRN